MNIGNVIKNARIIKKLTQENLADALGISIQAVSRWETGVSYPDITMIPSIANYLNITADQLFSINLEKRKINIQKILDLDDDYTKKFDLKSSLKLLETSLKQYPNDEYLLQRLTRNYHNQICFIKEDNEEDLLRAQELRRKIVENSLKVLEIAKDDEVRLRANTFLCSNYAHFGEEGVKKAKGIANKIASIYFAREELFANILTGEDKKNQIQSLMIDCLKLLTKETGKRALYLLKSPEEKITMLKKSIELVKIMIGDNLFIFNGLCSKYALKIAQLYASIEDKENTIYYLDESIKYAKVYSLLPNEGVYDSFWLNNQRWEKTCDMTPNINIKSFDDEVFDFIRDTVDFKNAKEQYIMINKNVK